MAAIWTLGFETGVLPKGQFHTLFFGGPHGEDRQVQTFPCIPFSNIRLQFGRRDDPDTKPLVQLPYEDNCERPVMNTEPISERLGLVGAVRTNYHATPHINR